MATGLLNHMRLALHGAIVLRRQLFVLARGMEFVMASQGLLSQLQFAHLIAFITKLSGLFAFAVSFCPRGYPRPTTMMSGFVTCPTGDAGRLLVVRNVHLYGVLHHRAFLATGSVGSDISRPFPFMHVVEASCSRHRNQGPFSTRPSGSSSPAFTALLLAPRRWRLPGT